MARRMARCAAHRLWPRIVSANQAGSPAIRAATSRACSTVRGLACSVGIAHCGSGQTNERSQIKLLAVSASMLQLDALAVLVRRSRLEQENQQRVAVLGFDDR